MTLTVYLAGGMRSNWQDRIIEQLKDHNFNFIDPRKNGQVDAITYTPWDLFLIERADIVFAYIEKDNPSGVGAAYEMGYGSGLNKHIVSTIETLDRYWDFVRIASDVNFYLLDFAIEYMKTIGDEYV